MCILSPRWPAPTIHPIVQLLLMMQRLALATFNEYYFPLVSQCSISPLQPHVRSRSSKCATGHIMEVGGAHGNMKSSKQRPLCGWVMDGRCVAEVSSGKGQQFRWCVMFAQSLACSWRRRLEMNSTTADPWSNRGCNLASRSQWGLPGREHIQEYGATIYNNSSWSLSTEARVV